MYSIRKTPLTAVEVGGLFKNLISSYLITVKNQTFTRHTKSKNTKRRKSNKYKYLSTAVVQQVQGKTS
jgi:hypothetical protein